MVHLTRLHHKTAKKLYEQGHSVYICPCKLSPTAFNNAFSWLVCPNLDHSYYSTKHDKFLDYTFPEIVENFKSYNCNTYETGYHCTYWITNTCHKHL